MQLPSIIKKKGNVLGENKVYIEDYVYTYLNGLGEKITGLPIRIALYGHAWSKEEKKFFLIYGASCVVEELQRGRNQEQIQSQYFPDYSLIGYVNIYSNSKLSEKDGYYIFYETNEPMQNYLISCYGQKKEGKQQNVPALPKDVSNGSPLAKAGELLKKAFLFCLTVLAAVSVLTINEYARMHDFTEMAVQVMKEAEKIG